MGRLEKQIIIGALALVGILLTVVVLKGLKPRDGGESSSVALNGWDSSIDERPDLVVEPGTSTPLDLDGPSTPAVEPVSPDFSGTQPPVVPHPAIDDTPAPSASSEPWIYIVQRGEVLGKISERELGSVKHIGAILDLNPGMTADDLVEGDPILMPPVASLQSRQPRTNGQRTLPQGTKAHTVAAGESLWAISMKYYGSDSGIERIVAANRGLLASKETVLRIDWSLVIPQ